MDRREFLINFSKLCLITAAGINCSCAVVYGSVMVCSDEYKPSLSKFLENASYARLGIDVSTMLLEIPLSEKTPTKSALKSFSGQLSSRPDLLLKSSDKIVEIAPIEIDEQTGLPKPTSLEYRNLLDLQNRIITTVNPADAAWFRKEPKSVVSRLITESGSLAAINQYRNLLSAYSAVITTQEPVTDLQCRLEEVANLVNACNSMIAQSRQDLDQKKISEVLDTFKVPGDEEIRSKLADVLPLTATLERQKRQQKYGKLANQVCLMSACGADMVVSAQVKLLCALGIYASAVANPNDPLRKTADPVILVRIKNLVNFAGLYKDCLSMQRSVFMTMYRQIRGSYEISDTSLADKVMPRLQQAEKVLAHLEPKLQQALSQHNVSFDREELRALEQLAGISGYAV